MAEVANNDRDRGPAGHVKRASWLAFAALALVQAAAQIPDQGNEDAAADTRQAERPADPAQASDSNEAPASGQAAADDETDDSASASAAADQLVTRLEALIEFRALADEGRFEEALPVGEQMLSLTEQEFGERSREAAGAYMELGEVQRRAGEHDSAEISFLQAIELYRALDGPYAADLIEPLVGLGDNYQSANQHQNAVSAYNEARTVSRRAHGLLNEEQIPILDRMTDSLVRMNLYAEATEQQVAALELVERNHPPDSPQVLDAIHKYARWLRESGRYREEREQYQRAIQLIRAHAGRDDPRMVRPLRETGNSFRSQRLPENQGANALKRALDILEAQADPDPLALAEVLRDMGDWQVAFSRVGAEGTEYVRAWQLLEQVDIGEELRRDWFTGPEYVLREPVSQRGLSNEPDARRGHVLVQFDLDESGRTENVEVLSSDPAGLKDDAVLQSVRRSRFRPQMADGEIVRGERLALQFVYRYLPE